MTRDDGSCGWALRAGAPLEAASHGADDDEDAPVVEPAYSDLLDADWLRRGTDALDPDDDLVDVGLTIDMTDGGDLDEGQAVDLDVGALLTSVPSESLDPADAGHAAADGLGALQELLLPDERGSCRREDDEEVGDDERFPVFDGFMAPRPSAPLDDDAEGPSEG